MTRGLSVKKKKKKRRNKHVLEGEEVGESRREIPVHVVSGKVPENQEVSAINLDDNNKKKKKKKKRGDKQSCHVAGGVANNTVPLIATGITGEPVVVVIPVVSVRSIVEVHEGRDCGKEGQQRKKIKGLEKEKNVLTLTGRCCFS